MGDTAWLLFQQCTEEEAFAYLKNRWASEALLRAKRLGFGRQGALNPGTQVYFFVPF